MQTNIIVTVDKPTTLPRDMRDKFKGLDTKIGLLSNKGKKTWKGDGERKGKTFTVLRLDVEGLKSVYFIAVSGHDLNIQTGKPNNLTQEFFKLFTNPPVGDIVCRAESQRQIYAGLLFPHIDFWGLPRNDMNKFADELEVRFREYDGMHDEDRAAVITNFRRMYQSRFISELYSSVQKREKHLNTIVHLLTTREMRNQGIIQPLRVGYSKPTLEQASMLFQAYREILGLPEVSVNDITQDNVKRRIIEAICNTDQLPRGDTIHTNFLRVRKGL